MRELLLLVESLVLDLGTEGLTRPPEASLICDLGAHFFMRLIVAEGPHFTSSYEVHYHSFGTLLDRPCLQKSVRVEEPREGWEIGLLEDVSDDEPLASLWREQPRLTPELFCRFVRRGYGEGATLFRLDRWEPGYVAAHKPELLWESYSEGITRYAFPLRQEEAVSDALSFLLEALGRAGIRPDWGRGVLCFPEGGIAVEPS